MAFYKFTANDLFVNQIEAYPSCRFDIYNSKVYYNNRSRMVGAFDDMVLGISGGHVSLYEMNVDRTAAGTGIIFPFLQRDSSLTAFKSISSKEYYSFDYGTEISNVSGSNYPLSASITREFFNDNHSSSMSRNNQAIIHDERLAHWDGPIRLSPDTVLRDGVPNFLNNDPVRDVTAAVSSTAYLVGRTSYQRYLRLKTMLSSSHIQTLKNTINHYSTMSPHFQYSASFASGYERDLDVEPVNLISIPGIFYGSSIRKGTINLKYYLTGTLLAELEDENKNGELIQTGPPNSNGSGNVAGIALYNQGFLILTGNWDIQTTGPSGDAALNYQNQGSAITSSWLYFGVGANDGMAPDGEHASQSRASASYCLEFSGTTETPVVTMFAHAPKGKLNYSNNPTYLSYSAAPGDYDPVTSSISFREPDFSTVNVVSSSFVTPTASFAKHTYISQIGLYDRDKNLIGVTTVANPVKKTEERQFSFKLKLDI